MKSDNDGGGRKKSQADQLVEIAAMADLFHARDETGYADIEVNGHRETWAIRSRDFRRWLAFRYFEATGGAASSEALHAAINVIEARAQFDGPTRAVHIRIGEEGGRVYLDLCDEQWRAVEVDTSGWRVIDRPPVRFRRTAGMLPLPTPIRGGSIELLRPFVNVRGDADFVLSVAWLLAALRGCGPYPVLALSGEQGAAKSTFAAILRALVDPKTPPLRALPREDRDLFIAATNGHVLAFDNISSLPAWTSDTFCRLATGGGFAVRRLYSDQDEILFDAVRPVILNGIADVVTRPDLADRTLFLTLEAIPDECRRPEADLWKEFRARRPRILGALLDATAEGLRNLPKTKLERLPRMADFALWATACESAMWSAGSFSAAYDGNREEAIEDVLDADPVTAAVRAFIAERMSWSGTASQLLNVLAGEVEDRVTRSKAWPQSARPLSARLRRGATFLRKVGIAVDFAREGPGGRRVISIIKHPSVAKFASAASPPSAAVAAEE